MRGRLGLAVLLTLGAVGCDDSETSGFDVVASASRTVGNAPLPISFSARTNGPLEGDYRWAWDFGDGETSDEAAPTHVFAQPGAYTVTVTVTEGGSGAAGKATVAVEVDAAADLVISDVVVDPRRARAGETINFSWGFQNRGAAVRGGWATTVFLSRDATFGPEDIVVFERPHADDAPSDRPTGVDEPITLPADLTSGDWMVGVFADAEGVVGDLDRADNLAFAPFPLEVRNPTDNGPDLIVCGVSIPAFDTLPAGQTPIAQIGDQLPVKVCLGNNGNQPTPLAGYVLYLSRDEAVDPADRPVGGRDNLALGAGDREDFDDLVDLPLELDAGVWYVLAAADVENRVEEQSETNNERGWPGPIELVEAGMVEGVDLVVARLEVQGDRGFWGQALPGTLQLVNRGNVPVERNFVVRLLALPVDGGAAVQLPSINVPGIAAGGDVEIPLMATITRRVEEGDYRLAAEADPTNATDDVNPGNNRRTLQQVLRLGGEPRLDPAVSGVTLDLETVEAGDALTVQGTLRNMGTDATGSFEVAVVFSADALIDGGDVEVDRFTIEGLDGEAELPVTRPVTVPVDLDQQVPVWRVALVVDPADRLTAELDEANNVAFAPAPLTVTGAMGGCAEDLANEDNDTPADAVTLAAGAYPGLGACDAADWFAVQVPAGQVLDVSLGWAEAEGTLTLTLADAEGEPLRSGEGPAGALRAFEAATDAERTVLVQVAGVGARLQYDLGVALTPAGDGPNLRVRAVTASPAVVVPGATVEVRFELVNVGGAEAGASAAGVALSGPSAADLGTIEAPTVGAGEAVAVSGRVEVPGGLATGRYVLAVTADADEAIGEGSEDDNVGVGALRVDPDQACEVDALEPNGSPYEPENVADQAAAVAAGEYDGLFVCRGDDDWYAIELAEGERLTVTAAFTHLEGDIDLALYAPDGATLIADSASLQNTESVGLLRAPMAGTWLLRVYLAAGDGTAVVNGYGLTVEVEPADACADDRFEPNGSAQEAELLPDGRHDLTLCPGDEDWFRFSIPAGNTVSFQVASGDAGVRITLFDPSGAEVDDDLRRIAHEATTSGFHLLRAQVVADEPVVYQLVVAGVSGVDLAVTAVRLSAAEVGLGGDLRAEVDIQNQRGDVARDLAVQFLLSADDQPSADDVELARAEVARVDGAASQTITQRLRVPRDAMEGDGFVVVVLDPERQIADVRRGNDVGAAPLSVAAACVDDDPRSNEGPATATPLDASPLEGGVVCPFTEDWYALDLDAAGALTVRLAFDHALGDLDLVVWDAEGAAVLGESRTEADEEVVELALDAPGRVLLQVDGFLDARNTYTLDWERP